MTQAELVAATGLSLRQIQRYEAGQSMPTWKNLDKLGEALGPKVYEIVHDDDSEEAPAPDLLGALSPPEQAQLDRIEEKLDEILRRLPPAEDDDDDQIEDLPDGPGSPPDEEDEGEGQTGTEG